jgi:hypothetical protein
MRRLQSYNLHDNAGRVLMHKNYYYNAIGGVAALNSDYAAANINIIEKYYYDADNRLAGGATGDNRNNGYILQMTYSPAGRILSKNLQGSGTNNNGRFALNFVNNYTYNHSNNPYAVSDLSGTDNSYYLWDNAGNLCFTKGDRFGLKFFSWTEDNRMQGFYHNKGEIAALYRYDASGQRELKMTAKVVNVTNNGYTYKMPIFTDATLYACNLMTVSKGGYVKQYFAENERILSNVST